MHVHQQNLPTEFKWKCMVLWNEILLRIPSLPHTTSRTLGSYLILPTSCFNQQWKGDDTYFIGLLWKLKHLTPSRCLIIALLRFTLVYQENLGSLFKGKFRLLTLFPLSMHSCVSVSIHRYLVSSDKSGCYRDFWIQLTSVDIILEASLQGVMPTEKSSHSLLLKLLSILAYPWSSLHCLLDHKE